jgi:hypothetical protein
MSLFDDLLQRVRPRCLAQIERQGEMLRCERGDGHRGMHLVCLDDSAEFAWGSRHPETVEAEPCE